MHSYVADQAIFSFKLGPKVLADHAPGALAAASVSFAAVSVSFAAASVSFATVSSAPRVAAVQRDYEASTASTGTEFDVAADLADAANVIWIYEKVGVTFVRHAAVTHVKCVHAFSAERPMACLIGPAGQRRSGHAS